MMAMGLPSHCGTPAALIMFDKHIANAFFSVMFVF